jgi:ATP-dependent Clp protease protease subunit
MRALMEEMIAKHSGRPIEQVHADVERDKILTTQEAIDYGIVDAFTTSRKASLTR